jgi:N-acetylneuraminate synthase
MSGFGIAGRAIGDDQPVYVIAEMSANHGGSLERAQALVREVARAGADALKVQAYTADSLTLDSDAEPFQIASGSHWDGRTLHDLYAEAALPWEWIPPLAELASGLGMTLFSSVFDEEGVQFLEEFGMPAYKVASCELVDLPLLQRIARVGKPIILSTGMASVTEIDEAIATIRAVDKAVPLALLKCTASYPAPPEEINLRTIADMTERFGLTVGLSDHTLGTAVAVAAVVRGATMIEKHVCLSRADGGPDAHFSIEPDELERMVDDLRQAHAALGTVRYGPSAHEAQTLPFRRSLFVVRDVRAGEELTAAHVRSIRPANGLAPKHLTEVLGRRAAVDIARGTPLTWDAIEP